MHTYIYNAYKHRPRNLTVRKDLTFWLQSVYFWWAVQLLSGYIGTNYLSKYGPNNPSNIGMTTLNCPVNILPFSDMFIRSCSFIIVFFLVCCFKRKRCCFDCSFFSPFLLPIPVLGDPNFPALGNRPYILSLQIVSKLQGCGLLQMRIISSPSASAVCL